jgi:hypothetical protein
MALAFPSVVRARVTGSLLFVSLLGFSALAEAQDDEGEPSSEAIEGAESSPEDDAEAGTQSLGDEQALQEEKASGTGFRQGTDPHEEPGKAYMFAGANWRYLRMPSWTLEMFVESAPSLGAAGSFFGEFGYRKDGFQVTGALGWLSWNFTGPFQLAGDPDTDTEWIEGDFNLIVGSGTFTWSTAFTDWFAVEYGLEAGLALVTGDMTRSEAYRDANGDFAKCERAGDVPGVPASGTYCAQPLAEPGQPRPATNEADEDGEHYGVKQPKGIANGGVPRALPVLGPRLSLRFKPIKQLVLRVDVPLPIAPFGFMGGLSAHYGF